MNKSSSDGISFGEWVRQQRRILDLTQQELADRVGCARITLRRIESGGLKPSKELAQILLEKLGAPQTEREKWLRFARGLSGFPEHLVEPSASKPSTNLPASLTTFVGREKEQREIMNLISKNRLVTLAGVGGIGKTRLALQMGYKLLNDYPNGIWFIPLDSLSDPALVPQTVASVFGVREGSSDQPLLERLTYSLRQKTVLLIVDNCEHLLDACSQLLKTLLTNCANLKILATSREVLNMEGEATYYLPSLSTPDDNTSLEALTDYESTRLFTERASLALSSFRLTKENTQPIVEICRKVDGIPLAIELAAARVNILNVEEILNQLDNSFALLARDSRTVLPRHQTLQASIDWSWGLLSRTEQKFLGQLSIFSGGWTLESALAVCDVDILSLTTALVKKSLMIVNQEAGSETRYGFHEIIHQYAREKLVVSGEEADILTRHLKYFLQFSEQAETALRGPGQMEWYARLNNERDNIRTALAWADKTNLEAGLCLAARMERYWRSFDIREGNHWLSKFLQKPESHGYPRIRAKALNAYGWILVSLQQFDAAHSAAQECINLSHATGDQPGEIDGLLLLGVGSSNITLKLELAQQVLEIAQLIGDVRRQAEALIRLGWIYPDEKKFSYWEKAIALTRQFGDWRALAGTLSTMGLFLVFDANIASAKKYLDESNMLYQQLNIKPATADLLSAYGQIALIEGSFEKAYTYFQEAAKMGVKFGSRQDYLWSQARLGYVAVGQGRVDEAGQYFIETACEFFNDKNEIGVVFSLEGIAGLNVAIGKPEVSAQLIGWADATRKRIYDTRPRLEQAAVDRIIAVCLEKIGEAAFSDAYDEGQTMTLDEAVAYALNEK